MGNIGEKTCEMVVIGRVAAFVNREFLHPAIAAVIKKAAPDGSTESSKLV